jgi:hypothetical protein
MPEGEGNAAQVRAIATQLLDAYGAVPVKTELPPALKLAGGIIAAIMTMGSLALAVWLISTVNQMQVTLARMDERQILVGQSIDARLINMDSRVGRLEAEEGPKNGNPR